VPRGGSQQQETNRHILDSMTALPLRMASVEMNGGVGGARQRPSSYKFSEKYARDQEERALQRFLNRCGGRFIIN